MTPPQPPLHITTIADLCLRGGTTGSSWAPAIQLLPHSPPTPPTPPTHPNPRRPRPPQPLQRNMVREATAFLLDVLQDNSPAQAVLQTKLLEINLVTNPQVS